MLSRFYLWGILGFGFREIPTQCSFTTENLSSRASTPFSFNCFLIHHNRLYHIAACTLVRNLRKQMFCRTVKRVLTFSKMGLKVIRGVLTSYIESMRMLSRRALKPRAPVFFVIAFLAISRSALSVKCSFTWGKRRWRLVSRFGAEGERYRDREKSSYTIHLVHLFVLLSKSVLGFCQHLQSNDIIAYSMNMFE